jgi:glycosyltransferase involved in cell wall biosynthesis
MKNRGYMKLISSHSDCIFCCSKKMADMAEETYAFQNIRPLWNPCDLQNILEQSCKKPEEDISFFRTEDKVLISMGREDDVKGFWHLLKIFKRIHEENADTRLAIVGDGTFAEYRRLAEELKIEDKVLFTGLKINPFPYLKESDIYLLTSLSEGLPNALVEALTLSLPVVSANCLSGPAEILHGNFKEAEQKKEIFYGDFGILTPVLSVEKKLTPEWQEDGRIKLEEEEEDMAQAVLLLMREKELYEKYRERARQRAEAFSPDNYLKGLLLCMEQL